MIIYLKSALLAKKKKIEPWMAYTTVNLLTRLVPMNGFDKNIKRKWALVIRAQQWVITATKYDIRKKTENARKYPTMAYIDEYRMLKKARPGDT